MVLQFTSQYDPKAIIYMGENMEENFNIREYAWPNDVYFHVKGLSSADVLGVFKNILNQLMKSKKTYYKNAYS